MSDIEDQLIFRKIHASVKSHGKFDHAKIGGQMPAIFADFFYYEAADLGGKLVEAVIRKQLDVVGVFYVFK